MDSYGSLGLPFSHFVIHFMVFPGTLTNNFFASSFSCFLSFVNCENLQVSDWLFCTLLYLLGSHFNVLMFMKILALTDSAESCLISRSQFLLLHLLVFRCIIHHIPDSTLCSDRSLSLLVVISKN